MVTNNHVLGRIQLLEAIPELPAKWKIASGFWSCEHYVKLFTFMLTSTQSWRLRRISTLVFRTHVRLRTPSKLPP